MKKLLLFIVISIYCPGSSFLPAQEALVSQTELYYDFLSLQGLSSRPYLNYRTLSDSKWTVTGDSHPWQDQNLGIKHLLTDNISLRVYGPEIFTSFNSAAPYGQNDGALWQGKGLNASLSGGVRLEGYGVELTFKPELAFSQNLEFDIMPQNDYANKYGYFWGYGGNRGADAPQRFGDKPFVLFDWGDSELRYTWKNLTAGFGTQAIWLGPAYLNPILHSNNAPTYPKFDFGLRRQPVTIPWVNWYIGDVEARLWVGQLTESDYFDNDPSNNHTMFHGFSFAYAPSFVSGLTLFANRVCLVPWAWENLKYIIPKDENTIEDQKASLGLSWVFPQIGFEFYGEIGVDDYVKDGFIGYLRHPFHTNVYTAGFKKIFNIMPQRNIAGELIFEFNWMEMTQTFYFKGNLVNYSFYFHHQLGQGYTNKGQWLGGASSPGGNSQMLKFVLYYPKGTSEILVARNNPDTNYIITHGGHNDNYWANFIIGTQSTHFVLPSLQFSWGLTYDLIIDKYYQRNPSTGGNTLEHNLSVQLSAKLVF